jgi:hypothetical protein
MCTMYTRIDTDIPTFVKCDLINSHHHVCSKLTCKWLLTFWRNLLASISKVEYYHLQHYGNHKPGANNLNFYRFEILTFQNYFLVSDLANKMYHSCIIKILSFHSFFTMQTVKCGYRLQYQ